GDPSYAVTFLPLAALAVMSWLIWKESDALGHAMRSERSLIAALPRFAERLSDAMLEARLFAGTADAPPLAPLGDILDVTETRRSGSMTALEQVRQGYAARAECDIHAIRQVLQDHAAARVDRLQRYHELAFFLGIAGSVAGFVIQFLITQTQVSSGG